MHGFMNVKFGCWSVPRWTFGTRGPSNPDQRCLSSGKIYGLCIDAVNSVEWQETVNWKRYGRKRSWPNFVYYATGLKKTTNCFSHDGRFLRRDLTPSPRLYVGEISAAGQRRRGQ